MQIVVNTRLEATGTGEPRPNRNGTYVGEQDGPLSVDKVVEADLAVGRVGFKVRHLVAEAETSLLLRGHFVLFRLRTEWRRVRRVSPGVSARVGASVVYVEGVELLTHVLKLLQVHAKEQEA
jgi:hypothetical protein